MTANTTPQFSIEEARHLAQRFFGLNAEASPLPSERDQNFALETRDGSRFVLKVAQSAEERAVLDLQNAALRHVASHAPSLAVQRLVPTPAGEDIVRVAGAGGRSHFLRLMTWLDGTPLVQTTPHDGALLTSLGAALADLDLALLNFSHPAMHRKLLWDLRHADLALEHVALLPAEQQAVVQQFMAVWADVDWRRLRAGVIHGDGNDYNVLVREGRVVGFLDFGDMVHSAVVCDLAIAIAYAMLDKPEPLYAASEIISAYSRKYALTPAEIEALYPLAASRLCMSLCYAAHNANAKSGDAYQQVTSGPAWRLLQQLADIPARTAVRIMCGSLDPTDALRTQRRQLLGGNLSLSYRKPLHLVRGSMQYLWDADGRRYLDAYNNVPHVGHCHPRVVQAGCEQMAKLNTNTRYLHELANTYAERVGALLPAPLRVCYFVNSGSEANELALRLARAHTRQQDLIVLDHAYHGNTTTLIDISPYKHRGPGGAGAPPWLHVVPQPDAYRGPYKRDDAQAGAKYAQPVATLIDELRGRGKGLAGFIAESWPSVGGQLPLADGYLKAVYDLVHAASGICIADEVQTGYGRLGRYLWGFEAYDVVPDIVVLGKPIGNGHPIGAVITTTEIARSFDNGMEFFSTFGGNTVSCAIGIAVLDVLEQEHLQTHAFDVGKHLISGLNRLKTRYPIVGDVRGSGLFLGVELVRDHRTLEPATPEAAAIVNVMRERGILLGTDGPYHNVLKIRPPMPFTVGDADVLLAELDASLANHSVE